MSTALANIIERSQREREDWRYTDLEKLLGSISKPSASQSNVTTKNLPCLLGGASQNQRIVFMNGVLQNDKSQFGDLPATILKGDAANGYRLTLAAQSCMVTAPVELVFMSDGMTDYGFQLTVNIGANTSLALIEHHLAIGAASAPQVVDIDINLGAQAKFVHKKIVHNLSASAHIAHTNVHVEEGAYYRCFSLIKNTRFMRNEIEVKLAGRLAQCGLYGVMLLRGHEHADVVTRVHHDAPDGTSSQLFKAIVKDQARGVFQGKIKVAVGAQKTDGKQLCRALLLSDQAEMDAKPELEIYADDVACSHGCAIGDLDADAMFYLRSRGLNEAQARSLLLRAFVDEVIDNIQVEEAKSFVRDLAGGWMNE